jgi:hypothetical protein
MRIVHEGRSLVSRTLLASLTGLPVRHLARLYRERATNGHPDAAYSDPRHGRALYFDEEAVLRWFRNGGGAERH